LKAVDFLGNTKLFCCGAKPFPIRHYFDTCAYSDAYAQEKIFKTYKSDACDFWTKAISQAHRESLIGQI
jgi:hypothetical protein